MATEEPVRAASELAPGKVTAVGPWAVGNSKGDYFAVTRRCRHLFADLAGGAIDSKGCLVCPWHGSRYDVKTGRMVLGPQGIFAKIPGLCETFQLLTQVLPFGRRAVIEPTARSTSLDRGDRRQHGALVGRVNQLRQSVAAVSSAARTRRGFEAPAWRAQRV